MHMALHRRSPRSLSHALAPLADAVSPQTLLAEVQAAWPTAVGALVAQEARPVSERAGTLTVACSAAVWAQELELISESIIERLNTGLAKGRISDLRCVTEAG
jgi:predicted nucleic acid-binding Zn ribbon protein